MRKELFETGKTVDAAIDSACEKLGCLREDCEWEIIDLPKKGFLGLKNIPAKVRVSIEVPDEKPIKAARPPQPVVNQRQQEVKPQIQNPVKNQRFEKPQQTDKFQQAGKPQQVNKSQQFERPQQAEKPQQIEVGEKNRYEKQSQFQPRVSNVSKKAEALKTEEISEKEAKAKDYIASVLDAAGLKANFEISREHGGSYINIVGDGLGMVIGRRGETLDALQYLAGLVANRADGDYLRLTVDCGDYRVKRKGTLEALARKLASQVLKTNISKTLEPMNPFERRIIHATVSEIEGVSSSSIGEEPNRRVVITSPSAKSASRSSYRGDRDNRVEREVRSDRGNSRDSYSKSRGPRNNPSPRVEASGETESGARGERGGYGRDKRGRDERRGGGRPRQAQPAPQGPPKQTPESEKTVGISFGKIDL